MIGKFDTRRLALLGVLAAALAACGGSTAASPAASGAPAATQAAGGTQGAGGTQAPAATQAAEATEAPAATEAAGGGENALAALSGLNSYKIKLSIESSGVTGGVASMGNITMSGIVVLKPEKASDITMSIGGGADASSEGMGIRMVEVNGKSYTDIGTGDLVENTDPSSTSLADSLSPEKLLGETTSYLKDMKPAGDETKNGIATTHFTADESVLKEAAVGLALLGLTDAKWKWDVWLAKDGGYVVSYMLVGSGGDGATMTMALDISDVNSPDNAVKAP